MGFFSTCAKGGGTGHCRVFEDKWLSKEPLLQQNVGFLGLHTQMVLLQSPGDDTTAPGSLLRAPCEGENQQAAGKRGWVKQLETTQIKFLFKKK